MRERQVRDDCEGACRPCPIEHVGLDHGDGAIRVEAPVKLSSEVGSKLERKHLGACVSEGPRQCAGAGPDVDDELAGRDTSLADEVRCESATTKKVPSGRTLCGSPPNGHGRPPSSRGGFYVSQRGPESTSPPSRFPDASLRPCMRVEQCCAARAARRKGLSGARRRCACSDSRHVRRRSGKRECAWEDSNLRPRAPEARALSPELQARSVQSSAGKTTGPLARGPVASVASSATERGRAARRPACAGLAERELRVALVVRVVHVVVDRVEARVGAGVLAGGAARGRRQLGRRVVDVVAVRLQPPKNVCSRLSQWPASCVAVSPWS